MYRVFIVEDDAALSELLAHYISAWGHEVRRVRNFQHVLEEFSEFDPHLVVMDVMLPFFNGYHWCQEIRRISNVPVVYVSSASDKMNIVMAMNMGGDDFIAKPVDPDVLMAKLMAVLRRAWDMPGRSNTLEYRGAVLNLDRSTLHVGQEEVELTKNELRILQTLMENRGRVVSRDTLMNKLWQMDDYVEENTLTVNVTRLRRKLEAAGLPRFITTRVGSGYLIE